MLPLVVLQGRLATGVGERLERALEQVHQERVAGPAGRALLVLALLVMRLEPELNRL